jgi:hypothetical protein
MKTVVEVPEPSLDKVHPTGTGGDEVRHEPSRAQSQEDIAKRFAGMWRLVSNPQRLVDGTTREGSNSVGYAFFDANAGHMCFLREERVLAIQNRFLQGALDDIVVERRARLLEKKRQLRPMIQ